ncbi:hypothetical protein [Cronobacter sakazakii]|uniref:hypothetical protein n=1 Tax=Cronobacter sakazakii TaxID=28141 RepID=UPI0021B01490|nr:hypothetical protein [Cronobacter sakazakii]
MALVKITASAVPASKLLVQDLIKRQMLRRLFEFSLPCANYYLVTMKETHNVPTFPPFASGEKKRCGQKAGRRLFNLHFYFIRDDGL